jgi:hypothetical protein
MALLRMKGSQIVDLKNTLKTAFDFSTFEDLLLRLDRRPSDFAGANDDLPTVIRKTLVQANAQLWWRDLLREACNAVPDPHLLEFLKELGFAPNIVTSNENSVTALKGRQLELKIRDSGSTFDIMVWRTRLAEVEGRVCRVELPELNARGTGFLIGPDLVLTNYHVVEAVHRGGLSPDKIVLRFDYKVLNDGVSVGPGKTYGLAGKWLVDHSCYSAHDFEVQPRADAASDELDYALLRTTGRPGDDLISGDAQAPVSRKWIEPPAVQPPETDYDFLRAPALYIVQHPDGKPMQIALDSNAVTAASTTRVRYTTTTEPGSSGSPCFSADWKWIALHHSGDPKYWKEGKKPEYNQGIPASAIMRLLVQRGKAVSAGGVWNWN